MAARTNSHYSDSPGDLRPPGLSRTYVEDLMQPSIARNDGDSDPIMDEALRRAREGR
ncbi:hypothetical protein KPP03845_200097 (plasmid) [Streptomyces xanthophaeus]|uniref:hypothetical protein n=1 Tax=Streptomyces xanthophaeus TaxID=67385 RepID=UPI00233EE759|nr:hypothetical protein [Streptomyces xanthophaeus]WCD91136.1 hypothetical protein KPP03845_200097 [Streptomyces xanthophaeus]